ncbi:ComEA family DNA-binding protein [Desulforegula conservatrix]|uniref:ComEA family DNA-binding protein n=1 Tax=Desulforegula conservatrix TaxID=153026 RepID=UPI0004069EDA|nr:helix-hairpin-helix domain-containing protein [Desulforegula conservatrix]
MFKRLLLVLAIGFFLFASPLFAMNKININKATVQELEQLKGVGPKIAQKIIDYRDKNGPFKKPEDITLVQGVGPKILETNKDTIVVSDDAQVKPAEGTAPPAAVQKSVPAAPEKAPKN